MNLMIIMLLSPPLDIAVIISKLVNRFDQYVAEFNKSTQSAVKYVFMNKVWCDSTLGVAA